MAKPVIQCCLSKGWGGLEMAAYRWTRAFREMGEDSVCWTRPEGRLVEVLQQENETHLTFDPKWHWKIFAAGGLRRTILEKPPKAIFVHYLKDLWFLANLKRELEGTKIIGISHHILSNVKKKDWLHRRIYSVVDQMIVFTEHQKLHVERALPVEDEKYVMIPNGTDPELFHPRFRQSSFWEKVGIESGGFVCGFVGRLDRRKGIFEAIEAVLQLRKSGLSTVHLVILGDGHHRDTILQMIREHEAESYIHYLGHQPNVSEYMANFDAFLSLSYEETFGFTTIEAMACETPVVGTTGGSTAGILRDGDLGEVVDVQDVEQTAQAIRKIYDDRDRAAQIATAARNEVLEKYDASRNYEMARQLTDL